jgi:hypothetical protein
MGPLFRIMLIVLFVALPLTTRHSAGSGMGDVPVLTDGLAEIQNLIDAKREPARDMPETVTLTGLDVHGLHCKTEPGSGGTLIRILLNGDTVPVRGPAIGGWLPVECAGQDGWINADYVIESGS